MNLIDDRSAAFREALAAAPALDAQVPTCPEWTLHDLAQHLGQGQRFWAAIVTAGAAETPPPRPTEPAPTDREELIAWFADSTAELLAALRETGPDAPCWTWWTLGQSPQNTAGAARRRLNETAVHTYDARLTAGLPTELPREVALDSVEEFLLTCCSTTVAWPHTPATLAFQATDGPTWYLALSATGAHATRTPATPAAPDATIRGTADELIRMLYGRLPIDSLPIDGDAAIFHQLNDWEPEE
nr:maleylpyruvate isomerase family mycothiol-dependent enzyme [Kitasatospora sp. SID7827]